MPAASPTGEIAAVQPGGMVESKADVLEIRLFGDTAVVVGRWRASGRNGDAPFDYVARFLSVWHKHAGQWQNIAYQSTDLPIED